MRPCGVSVGMGTQIDAWSRESELDSHEHAELALTKVQIRWKKDSFSANGTGITRHAAPKNKQTNKPETNEKDKKLSPKLTSYTKLTQNASQN